MGLVLQWTNRWAAQKKRTMITSRKSVRKVDTMSRTTIGCASCGHCSDIFGQLTRWVSLAALSNACPLRVLFGPLLSFGVGLLLEIGSRGAAGALGVQVVAALRLHPWIHNKKWRNPPASHSLAHSKFSQLRRRTNVQQLTCNIDLSSSFYYLFLSFVLLELKPFVLKGKVPGEKL